jgi:biopolymer transport protein ExbB/TolQ
MESPAVETPKVGTKVYEENSAILEIWSDTNCKIIKRSKELERLRKKKDELEKSYPFLTNIKGMLRKEREKKKSAKEGEEMETEESQELQKVVSPKTPEKKKRRTTVERLELAMETNRLKNKEVEIRTGVSREQLETMKKGEHPG